MIYFIDFLNACLTNYKNNMLFKFDKKSTGYILPKDTPNTTGGAHGGLGAVGGPGVKSAPDQPQPLILRRRKEKADGRRKRLVLESPRGDRHQRWHRAGKSSSAISRGSKEVKKIIKRDPRMIPFGPLTTAGRGGSTPPRSFTYFEYQKYS